MNFLSKRITHISWNIPPRRLPLAVYSPSQASPTVAPAWLRIGTV